jgi:nicotinamide-nucleotide amidase
MTPTDEELADLAERLGRALEARNLRVATAESCTGGWIAKALTDIPGSSRWAEGGVVAYSNSAKSSLLGVPAGTVATHGAVSEAVVRAMAEGARARSAPLTVAVSGVAGPTAAHRQPVGTVWFAWANGRETSAVRERFTGDRGGAPPDRRPRAAPAARAGRGAMSGGRSRTQTETKHATIARATAGACSSRFGRMPRRAPGCTRRRTRCVARRPADAKDRFHVTVVFLGNLTPAGFEIANAVPPILVGAFTLVLDTIGAFVSSRTLWLGARSVPPGWSSSGAPTLEALAANGFMREERIYRLTARAPRGRRGDPSRVAGRRARARRVAAGWAQRALRAAPELGALKFRRSFSAGPRRPRRRREPGAIPRERHENPSLPHPKNCGIMPARRACFAALLRNHHRQLIGNRWTKTARRRCPQR